MVILDDLNVTRFLLVQWQAGKDLDQQHSFTQLLTDNFCAVVSLDIFYLKKIMHRSVDVLIAFCLK